MKPKNRLTIQKPWGNFEQFTFNEKTTVKILFAKPGSALSLQYHNKREEFWRILRGKGRCVIGNDTFEVNEGDEFYISKKTNHRMMTEDSSVQWLEISFGTFDENDIVRLEDRYDRT